MGDVIRINVHKPAYYEKLRAHHEEGEELLAMYSYGWLEPRGIDGEEFVGLGSGRTLG